LQHLERTSDFALVKTGVEAWNEIKEALAEGLGIGDWGLE
jgi:hypothetical protein